VRGSPRRGDRAAPSGGSKGACSAPTIVYRLAVALMLTVGCQNSGRVPRMGWFRAEIGFSAPTATSLPARLATRIPTADALRYE
jgi:hypothetical protein